MHVLINDVVRSSFIRYARFLKVKHRWVYWLAFCQSLIDLQAANRSPRGWIIYGTRIAGPTPCSPRSQVGRSKMSCRVKGALLASGLRQRLTTPHDMSTRAATTKKRKNRQIRIRGLEPLTKPLDHNTGASAHSAMRTTEPGACIQVYIQSYSRRTNHKTPKNGIFQTEFRRNSGPKCPRSGRVSFLSSKSRRSVRLPYKIHTTARKTLHSKL